MDEIQKINTPCDLGLSKTFSYNGNKVRMKKVNGIVFVCLTDMAKGFPNKNLTNIVNSKEMQEYMNTLSRIQICSLADLLIVKNGGDGSQGTWAHRKVALRVAQKLSPEFAIWVDDRIEELLTYGFTATQPTLDEMVNNPDLVIKLATQLKSEREEKARLEQENAEKAERISLQDEQLKKQAPKVEYYDQVLQSEGTMTTRQLAMSIGMTANTLNKKLCDAGIQFRQSGMYILHAPYSSYNLTSVRSYPYTASDGRTLTKQYLVWNERGKQFVTMLHRNNFDAKKTRQEISPEFWLKMLRPQCLPNTDN